MGFKKEFYIANIVELFERLAYYGVFIAITLYLTDIVGFTDVEAAWISGLFSAGLYFLPPFSGAVADKIGFRKAMIFSFVSLSLGYTILGIFPFKIAVIPALIIVMIGGSFIKSLITGTVAITTTEDVRAKAYSIFYLMVNIGAFLGKTFAYPLRLNYGLTTINTFSGIICLIALIIVFFFYSNVKKAENNKSISDIWKSFILVVTNTKLLFLIILITGFWIIQHQMYATMPKYIIRIVGKEASPEWIANVNPFVVIISVYLVTHYMRNVSSLTSIMTGMILMPFSAIIMSLGSFISSFTNSVNIFSIELHPYTFSMIMGIVFQGLAESFISPRYLEFFSKQAPEGQEGLYLGFSHLHSFLSSILGFGLSGYLLSWYCPDPKLFSPDQLKYVYQNAHYIWYYFAAIGSLSAIGLYIYKIKYKL
ncbi:MAG TPA: MFS transporter [Ignavibacteriales bacterium]|nr:MFS transporter [Ignavibacteriales bacterium]HOL81206.1 MFS transporter [Ignavibacteriales bacterium]HOM65309.1 MFS transporter [Ignavibacteriales bacterium]HPD68103.1 MFS transporter [Ignavibacteriales bacterium]HPP33438.1 MFS transporter [Ignavibacteriales bacterium]